MYKYYILRKQDIMPQKMRVGNQSEYNKFLKIAGGNTIYSDKVVIFSSSPI